jgi:hypothetical protein
MLERAYTPPRLQDTCNGSLDMNAWEEQWAGTLDSWLQAESIGERKSLLERRRRLLAELEEALR